MNSLLSTPPAPAAGSLYRLALALRESGCAGLEPVRRLRWPVVSIGNLSTGGAGKTPLTIALAKALTAAACVWMCSRAATAAKPTRRPRQPRRTAEEFGDEPLLIARETGVPVYVAAQRYEAGLLAEASRASSSRKSRLQVSHLLDDGFQHRQLYRDVDILLLEPPRLADWPASRRQSARAAQSCPPRQRDRHSGRRAGTGSRLRAWGWQGPVWRLRRTMEIPAVEVRWSPSAASPARSSSSPASKPPACKSPPALPSPTTTATPPPT